VSAELEGKAPRCNNALCMTISARSRNPFVRSITLVLQVARRGRFHVALIGGFALPFHGVQRATGDIDFLADASGADALHHALLDAGARCLHRSIDAANYAAEKVLAPVDFIYARRERALDMLRRARPARLRGAGIRVPVVDAEALIGLKVQALVNAPARRAQDEADIRALVLARGAALNLGLVRDYFRLFGREDDLDRLLAETMKR
jgi:nucleotidyltransferase AbiEii toxin of type IV toxin-antitoxin system